MGSAAQHFRQGGRPIELLVLADVSRPLRDEERQAWQRLIRVHRPRDQQLARADQVDRRQPGSLLAREPMPADWNAT